MVIKTKLGSCISAAILNCNKHWLSYILSHYSKKSSNKKVDEKIGENVGTTLLSAIG